MYMRFLFIPQGLNQACTFANAVFGKKVSKYLFILYFTDFAIKFAARQAGIS
jgi:hypothetical protein